MKTKVRMILLGLLALQPAAVFAQEWNQWRGADRNGAVLNFSTPAAWPKTLTQKWKTPVGSSYSSPVVSQSRVYVHTRRDDQEVVTCLDWRTGKVIWTQSYAAP